MQLSKQFDFESSHRLPNHPGKCQYLHGHSWKLTLSIEGDFDDRTGFVLDYNRFNDLLKPVTDFMDHKHLNWFISQPSSEVILCVLANAMLPLSPKYHVLLTLCETCKTAATVDLRREVRDITLVASSERAKIPVGSNSAIDWTRGPYELVEIQEAWSKVLNGLYYRCSELLGTVVPAPVEEVQLDHVRLNPAPQSVHVTRELLDEDSRWSSRKPSHYQRIIDILATYGYQPDEGRKNLADVLVDSLRQAGVDI